MATTYEPIATTTLTSSATTFNFTSIPGTYTDLILVFTPLHTNGGTNWYLGVNSDTGANYSHTWMAGSGTAATSGRQSTQSAILLSPGPLGSPDTNRAIYIFNFMNYSNTTTYKTILNRLNQQGSANNGTVAQVGLWRSTSAITAINLDSGTNNGFLSGTTGTLYGIKAA